MIKKIKTLFLSASAVLMLMVPAMVPIAVHAQTDTITNNLCSGVNLDASKLGSTPTSGDATCTGDTTAGDRVTKIIQLIINIFSLIVGVVSVIMIIIGGLKYITSGGDSGNITGAKNTILYAIIGLVVVALAQVVVKFVLAKATS